MKQKILYTLFLTGLLASCSSDEEIVKSNSGYLEPGYGALTVTLSDPSLSQTRAVGDRIAVATAEEKVITSVAFFVNTEPVSGKAGNFGSYFSDEVPLSSKGLQEPLVATTTAGEYTCRVRHQSDGWGNPQVIVVANYAENGLDLKSVGSLAALEDVLTTAVAANPSTPLLMYSTKTIEGWKPVGGSDGGGIVTETFLMDRLVSRIDVHNMAYNKATESNGFVLKSAQLIRPRTASYLIPGSTKTAPAVSPTPFAALTNVVALDTDYQKIDTLYAYENANTTASEATALQINGTFRGTPVSKIVEFRKPMIAGVAGDPIALARNNRYVVNINPTPDSTDINWDIVVKAWTEADTIKVKPAYDKPEVTWAAGSFTVNGSGATWNPTTKTIDITNATAADGILEFTASGENTPDVEFGATYAYDADASSVGGTDALKALIVKENAVLPYSTTGKITRKFTVTIPMQATEKVPLDFYLRVYNTGSSVKADTIKITSRPNYEGTTVKPILMTDGKFWAPVNVGATKMPTGVAATSNTDVTESCGMLFQWGRKQGFAATNNAATCSNEVANVATVGWPTASDLATMETWSGKFIISGTTAKHGVNTQSNWLRINPDGDNPATMVNEAWYQQLWDSNHIAGQESKTPGKTTYDPCPAGWRVPSSLDWKNIAAGNTNIVNTHANQLLTITGATASEKLVLPAAGYRNNIAGSSLNQGSNGYYWSSSVPSGSVTASYVSFRTAELNASEFNRATGFSVRCIQQ